MSQWLLQDGLVYDGTGADPYPADIRLTGNRIAEIAPHLSKEAGETCISLHGKAVTPGFIDIHRHCDKNPFDPARVSILMEKCFCARESLLFLLETAAFPCTLKILLLLCVSRWQTIMPPSLGHLQVFRSYQLSGLPCPLKQNQTSCKYRSHDRHGSCPHCCKRIF